MWGAFFKRLSLDARLSAQPDLQHACGMTGFQMRGTLDCVAKSRGVRLLVAKWIGGGYNEL
jgi:hypothetical protein